MIELILPVALISFVYLYLTFKRPLGSPPGPFKFPLVGNYPQVFLEFDSTGVATLFSKWSKTYGKIFSVDFGSYPSVVLNDARLIREAFTIPQLCGRLKVPTVQVRMGEDGKTRGLIFNEGPSWTEQRRFAIRHLKDFGFGRNTMESIILDEAQALIENFKKEHGKPVSTQAKFNIAIINSLWTIVAGERFQHDDPKLTKLVDCVVQNLSETGTAGFIVFLPKLAQMFPKLSGWSTYIESFDVTREFIEDFVQTRMKDHKNGYLNDFTDVYLENINNTQDTRSSFFKEEGVRNLIVVLDDMFSAGGETTSTTLTWLFLCLATNPRVQEKLHAEINGMIGSGRLPSLADRPKMPYTEAVISEVLRIASIIPLGVFHCCLQDTVFHNFFIAKDTIVIPNIQGVHHDALLWGDPENFRPERFLTVDEGSVIGHEGLLPFSSGRRICLGETLAKDQLFLFSTAIVQTFLISPDPSHPLPSLTPNVNGLVAKTQPHKIIFRQRT